MQTAVATIGEKVLCAMIDVLVMQMVKWILVASKFLNISSELTSLENR
jgi:cell division protein FtsL